MIEKSLEYFRNRLGKTLSDKRREAYQDVVRALEKARNEIKMDEQKIKEAIEVIKGIEEVRGNLPEDGNKIEEAFIIAIKALEKQVPKKVEIREWSPAVCPSCGYELSESVGDGYYKHPTFLSRCPNTDCGQRLDWSD